MVLLIRLLSPDDFGLIAMIMVFVGFVNIFSKFGFGSALVQSPVITSTHKSSVFWISIGFGAILSAGFYLAAPLVGFFYGAPALVDISRVFSLLFVVTAVGVVPTALFRRQMKFDVLAKIDIAATFVSGLVAITFAYLGFGVWSLVAQYMVRRFTKVTLVLIRTQWFPSLVISFSELGDLFRFGANLTGFSFINYWARNIDDLLVGKVLGTASLGIYNRAYMLMMFPITKVISAIQHVMFSALSSIQEDRGRVKRIFLRAVRSIALVTFPLMMGMFAVADSFVLTFFGEEWAGIIPLTHILAPIGVLQALMNPTGWVFKSQGRTDWMFRWGLVGSTTFVIAIVIGIYLGSIESVALCYLGANILLFYPSIKIPGKLIDMTFTDLLSAVWDILCCALLMLGIVEGIALLMPSQLPNWLTFITLAAAGAVIYVTAISIMRIDVYLEIRRIIMESLLGRRSRSLMEG